MKEDDDEENISREVVRDFFDSTKKLELGLEWMEKYHSQAVIQAQLLSWMALMMERRDFNGKTDHSGSYIKEQKQD